MTRLFEARPFIIAEVGSSWRSLGHCLKSIQAAKEAGADAVKFQLFDEVSLYGHGFSYPSYGVDAKPPFLPPAWLPHLKAHADTHGIELMCSAFSPELVAAVDPYVSVHKVASSDAAWPQMLEAVANCGKPFILSTGAKTKEEIQRALEHIDRNPGPLKGHYRNRTAVLLYCVASYPTAFADLAVMEDMKTAFPIPIGFSDHTLGISMAVEAARQGAVVIEKHFTAFPEMESPDRGHSVGPAEFKMMVDYIRGTKKSQIGPSEEERDMLLKHNRRLLATQDIKPGDILKYGVNYGAFRSREDDHYGLPPFAWETVEGKAVVGKGYKRGEGIS